MRARRFQPTSIIPWIMWMALAIYVFKCMPPQEGEQTREMPSALKV